VKNENSNDMKMRIQNIALAALSAAAMLTAPTLLAVDEGLRTESQLALTNFLKADTTLEKFFSNSAGYAIFPNVGKGGFIVGGARGKGLVYDKANVVIGQATMTQASIGAQVGGQTFAELIFFETPSALEDFKSSKLEMSAEVSAVAAREGASKVADYKNGVVVFTVAKAGLMVQASIGGQKFKFEPEPLQATGRETPKKEE